MEINVTMTAPIPYMTTDTMNAGIKASTTPVINLFTDWLPKIWGEGDTVIALSIMIFLF